MALGSQLQKKYMGRVHISYKNYPSNQEIQRRQSEGFHSQSLEMQYNHNNSVLAQIQPQIHATRSSGCYHRGALYIIISYLYTWSFIILILNCFSGILCENSCSWWIFSFLLILICIQVVFWPWMTAFHWSSSFLFTSWIDDDFLLNSHWKNTCQVYIFN